MTHEDYLAAIVDAVAGYTPEHAAAIRATRVVYGTGAGRAGVLGTCFYEGWQNGHPEPVSMVEICAFEQDTPSQIAVTTVHELAHAVAPRGAGHGRTWKQVARTLGLAAPSAVSTGAETWDAFTPAVRGILESLPVPDDGKPLRVALPGRRRKGPRPCSAGNGARGGRSRGQGSGSRMIRCACSICGYTVRTSAKWLAVGYPVCPADNHGPMQPDSAFTRESEGE